MTAPGDPATDRAAPTASPTASPTAFPRAARASRPPSRWGAILRWGGLALALAVPLAVAAASPLNAWREPVYVAASLAGVLALGLLLVQPLLAGGLLPGLRGTRGRRVHALVGVGLVAALVVHVGGLWLTSPPDVVDALLFVSPAPFSPWGVGALWAAVAAALVMALRRRLALSPRLWRPAHTALAAVVVAGSIVHALLVEGTMGPVTKAVLCALALAAFVKVAASLRSWRLLRRRPMT